MTDADRAREIANGLGEPCDLHDMLNCAECVYRYTKLALAAVRAEERERAARIAETWPCGGADETRCDCVEIAAAIRKGDR